MRIRRIYALTLALLMAVAVPLLAVESAIAQEGGPPPWPILLEGMAMLNGAPADGELTAHIGDWVSAPVTVTDGRFDCPCLIVGPPNSTYVDQEVTFHLSTPDGATYQADLTFPFPRLPEPAKNSTELLFAGALPTPTPELPTLPIPASVDDGGGPRGGVALMVVAGGGAAAAVAGGAFLLLRRRRA